MDVEEGGRVIMLKTLQIFWRQLLTPPGPDEIRMIREATPAGSTPKARAQLLVREMVHRFQAARVTEQSAALTYGLGLSIAPLFALAISLFQSMGGFGHVVENTLMPIISEHFGSVVGRQLNDLLQQFLDNVQVGALGAIATATLLITVVSLFNQIERAFNTIFAVRQQRPLLQRIANYWILISLLPVVFVASSKKLNSFLADVAAESGVFDALSATPVFAYVVSFCSQAFVFSALLFFFPYRRLSYRAIAASAIATTILFEVLKFLNLAVVHWTTQDAIRNQIYGSIPLMIVLLIIWVRLAWMVVLAGACLCAALQKIVFDSRLRRRTNAPLKDAIGVTATFGLICEAFANGSEGLSDGELAQRLTAGPVEIRRWTEWLKDRGCIFATGEGLTIRLHPTAQGVKMERNVPLFLERVLDMKANVQGALQFEAHEQDLLRLGRNQTPFLKATLKALGSDSQD